MGVRRAGSVGGPRRRSGFGRDQPLIFESKLNIVRGVPLFSNRRIPAIDRTAPMSQMLSSNWLPLVSNQQGWPLNMMPAPGDFSAGLPAEVTFFFIAGAAVVIF